MSADDYFSTRLHAEAWDSADEPTRAKALAQAERQLEPHRDRADTTRFSYAVYEQALFLLQGDERSELQQAGVVSMSVGKLSETYKDTGRDPAIAPQAWAYLRGSSVKGGGLR